MKWPTLLIEPSAVGVKYTIPLVSFLSKLFSCPLKFIWVVSQKNKLKKKKKKSFRLKFQIDLEKTQIKKTSGTYLSRHKPLLRVNIRSGCDVKH